MKTKTKPKRKPWRHTAWMVEAANGDMLGPYQLLSTACGILDNDKSNKRIVCIKMTEVLPKKRSKR